MMTWGGNLPNMFCMALIIITYCNVMHILPDTPEGLHAKLMMYDRSQLITPVPFADLL